MVNHYTLSIHHNEYFSLLALLVVPNTLVYRQDVRDLYNVYSTGWGWNQFKVYICLSLHTHTPKEKYAMLCQHAKRSIFQISSVKI